VAVGANALAMLLVVEFTVVLTLRWLSISEYFSSRDIVSGLTYLAGLLLYALGPTLFYSGDTHDQTTVS
jgi:hypothetical protein